MMTIGLFSMGIVLAYLLGSISSAIIVSRLLGLPDPRRTGSNNPGATNVLRSSKRGAALTLAGDLFKGWLPVFIALQLDYFPAWMIGVIALAAFLGHLYPLYFGFKGGKGVATAFGIILAINPWAALLTLLTWVLTTAVTRYSSLAALVAALAAPVYLSLLAPEPWLIVTLSVMTILIFFRHYSNIQRLLRGTEPRIGGHKNAV